MTSRERVLTTLAHHEPDQVPIELGCTVVTGVMAIAYHRLKSRWGIEGPTRVVDVKQQLAMVEPAMHERIGTDCLPVLSEGRKWDRITEWKPGQMTDGTPCLVRADFSPETEVDGSQVLRDSEGRVISRCPPEGLYFDDVFHPLASAQDIHDIEAHDWEYELDPDLIACLKGQVTDLLEQTDKATVEAGFFPSVYEAAQALRGWEQFMMDLAADPRFAGYLMDKLAEVHIERFRQYIEAVGDRVHVIAAGDDLGMETGPQLSPDLYRRMVKPRQKRVFEYVKARSQAKVFLHSCGSIHAIIPDLIEIGVDILNPVQVAAADMDSAKLKREFGQDLVFWGGGCDTQRVLSFGTPADVREEVKRRIGDLAPGGGFVFNQVHNIQADVLPENMEAMYEAVHEYGQY